MQGIPLDLQTRREILRLAALTDPDGRRLWSCAAIGRQLGLDFDTVRTALRASYVQPIGTGETGRAMETAEATDWIVASRQHGAV